MRRRHPACGLTRNPADTRPIRCRRCDMVEDYHRRRAMYLDQVEQQGRGDDHYRPVVPRVTFRWWLEVYTYA